MKFTANEINLLADVLNGCGISIQVQEVTYRKMLNEASIQ